MTATPKKLPDLPKMPDEPVVVEAPPEPTRQERFERCHKAIQDALELHRCELIAVPGDPEPVGRMGTGMLFPPPTIQLVPKD